MSSRKLVDMLRECLKACFSRRLAKVKAPWEKEARSATHKQSGGGGGGTKNPAFFKRIPGDFPLNVTVAIVAIFTLYFVVKTYIISNKSDHPELFVHFRPVIESLVQSHGSINDHIKAYAQKSKPLEFTLSDCGTTGRQGDGQTRSRECRCRISYVNDDWFKLIQERQGNGSLPSNWDCLLQLFKENGHELHIAIVFPTTKRHFDERTINFTKACEFQIWGRTHNTQKPEFLGYMYLDLYLGLEQKQYWTERNYGYMRQIDPGCQIINNYEESEGDHLLGDFNQFRLTPSDCSPKLETNTQATFDESAKLMKSQTELESWTKVSGYHGDIP